MERKTLAIAAAACVIIGACAAQQPPPRPNPWTVIEAGLQRYRGHDIRELANVIGYPDAQRESLGTMLYSWNRSSQLPVPNGFGPITFFGISCQIEISVVRIQDIEFIDTWRLQGDGRACWQQANALR